VKNYIEIKLNVFISFTLSVFRYVPLDEDCVDNKHSK